MMKMKNDEKKHANFAEFRCFRQMFFSLCEVGRDVRPGQWPGGRPAEGPEMIRVSEKTTDGPRA